ncbi:hypothetical protein ASPSYDRAFT_88816 [Aspergillus sydowii CBS 593.65]|uniref:Uncharacterized protein n=1 Tax=Aspergillus sydowii CBS 593.65 TaxID=1036612 RepID=A0A1L9TKJ2_9EURO|nr:uncharacterized protein ASPSYDRAFT_88816 [Aspergillus sydowii CBS 593.65]OJJ59922.1 hypothetical protein ASPSYDRAFT_88816 [Aspergillus sydowii CBS 593.65]
MKFTVAIVSVLSFCATGALGISCGAQASSKGVRCVARNEPCPGGFRPVFYDDPAPCYNNQRCCV